MFDCENCQVSRHLTALDADNQRAWALTHTVCSRFLGDAHAVGLALNRLTTDLDTDDFADMLSRVTLIYDVLCPPPATNT